MAIGTDVNFGALTRSLFTFLQAQPNVAIHFNYEVRDLRRAANQHWRIRVAERSTGSEHEDAAAFVFIGAGGGSLPLLLQSGIPESRGYGGFPVSGQWLVCTNPAVIERHRAKVYGKAEVGAPPMSVPHLDTRFIDGRQALFFGPYAGFSTKFLKHGSLLDLPLALRANNILPMLAAGMDNLALTKYLVEQVIQSPEERVRALQAFYPEARSDEWELQVAGQRVQVIKHDEEHGGVLEFGTEVVSAADGRLAALLGASPGASTSVGIMLQVLKRCFPVALATPAWQARLHALIRSYGNPLHADPTLCAAVRARSAAALRLS
jgi:malate dehydrogenase (quinone)